MQERNPEDYDGEGVFVRQAHAPPHLFRSGATYFLSCKTLYGQFFVSSDERKEELISALHFASEKQGWTVVAWVALSNHYHCIVTAPSEGKPDLGKLTASIHRFTSSNWNEADSTPGRQVWYQYRDTCLTSEGSFWARVNYIHWNPVKHGLVLAPEVYPHSSYQTWLNTPDADIAFLEKAFPWDRLELE